MRPVLAATAACLLAVGSGACSDDDPAPSLYQRLGGEPGLRAIAVDFLSRASADEAVNGYFRNVSVDHDRIVGCLVKQLGAATGGPQVYPDPPGTPDGCRDMAAAHQGLGISTRDFDDVLAHLTAAVEASGASAADVAAVVDVIAPHRAAIVEDPTNDATVYQRIGRKPAISAAVTAFEARVAADDRVNGFFAPVTDLTRLHACLTRMLCAIDGPCRYGEEVAEEFAPLTGQPPCRPMAPAHFGLQDGQGGAIAIEHFSAIAENLIATLTEAGVPQADIDAIVGAIAPTCPDIVAGGTGCP